MIVKIEWNCHLPMSHHWIEINVLLCKSSSLIWAELSAGDEPSIELRINVLLWMSRPLDWAKLSAASELPLDLRGIMCWGWATSWMECNFLRISHPRINYNFLLLMSQLLNWEELSAGDQPAPCLSGLPCCGWATSWKERNFLLLMSRFLIWADLSDADEPAP